MLYSPHQKQDQPRCKFCGEVFRSDGTRRPREFCSNSCRQAAYRERRQDDFPGREAPPYRPEKNNEPATVSPKNSSTISRVEFRNKGIPAAPLNVFGGHHHWEGAGSVERATRIPAAIDAEIGIGGATIISSDGVPASIVPIRRASS